MSARTCRRRRIQMNNDGRYKKKDPVASARPQAAIVRRERDREKPKK